MYRSTVSRPIAGLVLVCLLAACGSAGTMAVDASHTDDAVPDRSEPRFDAHDEAALDGADASDAVGSVVDASTPHSSWGGAFEINDPACAPCENANNASRACGCPAGFTATGLRVLDDCRGTHGGTLAVCAPATGRDDDAFAGAYQQDDPVPSGAGCRTPNPRTGACSCPAGTTGIAARVLVDTSAGTIGSHEVFCDRTRVTAGDFGGGYQQDDAVAAGMGCRVSNPRTGACSCPAGFAPQGLRVLSISATGAAVGSTVVLCGLATATAPSQVALCAGVTADATGASDASQALQQCIDATPAGGTLELPLGTYRLDAQLRLRAPITIRTVGTRDDPRPCVASLVGCATLQAGPSLNVMRGFVYSEPTHDIVLDHLVLDGNRAARLHSAAAATCAGGSNSAGYNATHQQCDHCSFTHSATVQALCGSGFVWAGDEAQIVGSVVQDNGDHATRNMWSDGVTLLQSDRAMVASNRFTNNSDIDFICGGSHGGTFRDNVVTQASQGAFGGIMLDNFNGTTSGDFAGSTVTGNQVVCGAEHCDFGIELGPHPWYLSANIPGGMVTGNTVTGAKIGINVEGGGTAAAPFVLYANGIDVPGGQAPFNCGTRSRAAINVSPDSVVDRHGETFAVAHDTVHRCP